VGDEVGSQDRSISEGLNCYGTRCGGERREARVGPVRGAVLYVVRSSRAVITSAARRQVCVGCADDCEDRVSRKETKTQRGQRRGIVVAGRVGLEREAWCCDSYGAWKLARTAAREDRNTIARTAAREDRNTIARTAGREDRTTIARTAAREDRNTIARTTAQEDRTT
jgi:hypothetical protein